MPGVVAGYALKFLVLPLGLTLVLLVLSALVDEVSCRLLRAAVSRGSRSRSRER